MAQFVIFRDWDWDRDRDRQCNCYVGQMSHVAPKKQILIVVSTNIEIYCR